MKIHLKNPSAPALVTAGTPTATSVALTWAPVADTKAYIVRYAVDGEINDRVHYTEVPNFTLNNTIFNGTLAGLKLNITVGSLSSTHDGLKPDGSSYDGLTPEIQKANEGMVVDKPSNWAPVISVTFPASK